MEKIKLKKKGGGGGTDSLAFTLAEVLITLAIIGVVAALTIPTVVRNYQKTETVTRLKKTYAALANTTNLAMADHGPIQGWDIGEIGSGAAAQEFADTYMIPYLKVSKSCDTKITGDCAFKYTSLNKNTTGQLDSRYARFYLNDGTLISVYLRYYGYDPTQNLTATIHVDLNGQKPPNMWGKDIFAFDYQIRNHVPDTDNGKFVAWGSSYTRNKLLTDTWGCHKEGYGSYCAGLIMKDGWKISDDYPWN